MHDDAHRRLDRRVVHQPVLGLVPALVQFRDDLVVDDDKEVVIALVALGRVRFVHPFVAGVGTEQDDFQDTALFLLRAFRFAEGGLEFLVQDFHDALQFALLPDRQVIEIGFHGFGHREPRFKR